MSDSAFQEQFRQEFIAGFEKRESYLRRSVVTEAQVNGNQATFLVADSGSATAKTRGVNGDIPTRADNLNQYTATLQEWHDVPERTNFNIFASQGDGKRIMQETSMAVINRKIDSDIRAALSNATNTWGAATTATLQNVNIARTKLRNASASSDAPIFGLITPAYHAYLMQLSAGGSIGTFTSTDFVNGKPFEAPQDKMFNWFGVTWIVDEEAEGVGTASASCYMYSQNAIGHACDKEAISTFVGYDDKNDKSWARCSTYMGTKLLQNSGIIKMTHDDSALS